MSFATAMRIDHEHDFARSIQDPTRFGTALREHAGLFLDDGSLTAERTRFAWAAWQIARPPITEFVELHDRVMRVWVQSTGDALRVSVEIATPLSTGLELAALAGGDAATWCRSTEGRIVAPPLDLEATQVLPLVVMRVGIPCAELPAPAYAGDLPERATAIESFEVVCDRVNLRVGPVLDELTGPRRRW